MAWAPAEDQGSPRPTFPGGPLILRTRTAYKEPLLVGRDMMSFRIGDTVAAFSPDGARLKP